jgi:hypothetical protein
MFTQERSLLRESRSAGSVRGRRAIAVPTATREPKRCHGDPSRTPATANQQMQADHQPGRQAGPALLGVERAVLAVEPRPVNQPGEPLQLVELVDDVRRVTTEKVVGGGGGVGGLRMHRWARGDAGRESHRRPHGQRRGEVSGKSQAFTADDREALRNRILRTAEKPTPDRHF